MSFASQHESVSHIAGPLNRCRICRGLWGFVTVHNPDNFQEVFAMVDSAVPVKVQDEESSLLVLIIDTNPFRWTHTPPQPLKQQQQGTTPISISSDGKELVATASSAIVKGKETIVQSSPNKKRKHETQTDNDNNNELTLSMLLDHVFVFINAFLLLNQNNRLVVIACHCGQRCESVHMPCHSLFMLVWFCVCVCAEICVF